MAMDKKDNLLKNIIFLLSSLCFFQAFIILFIFFIFHTPQNLMIIFLILCPAIHIIIFLGLMSLRDFFIYSETGKKMEKINISNVLSIFRVSSAPTLLFLFLSAKYARIDLTIPIILFTAFVFLSDLFDGYLARKLREITNIGKYLDSSSDYIILFMAALVFLRYGLLPLFFFSILLIRLLVVAVGNYILYLKYGRIPYATSFLGKASVFAVMVYFAANILNLSVKLGNDISILGYSIPAMVGKIESMTAGILIITIIEKVNLFILSYGQMEREQI